MNIEQTFPTNYVILILIPLIITAIFIYINRNKMKEFVKILPYVLLVLSISWLVCLGCHLCYSVVCLRNTLIVDYVALCLLGIGGLFFLYSFIERRIKLWR